MDLSVRMVETERNGWDNRHWIRHIVDMRDGRRLSIDVVCEVLVANLREWMMSGREEDVPDQPDADEGRGRTRGKPYTTARTVVVLGWLSGRKTESRRAIAAPSRNVSQENA